MRLFPLEACLSGVQCHGLEYGVPLADLVAHGDAVCVGRDNLDALLFSQPVDQVEQVELSGKTNSEHQFRCVERRVDATELTVQPIECQLERSSYALVTAVLGFQT